LAIASELHISQLLDRTSLTPLYGDPFQESGVPDFIAPHQPWRICHEDKLRAWRLLE